MLLAQMMQEEEDTQAALSNRAPQAQMKKGRAIDVLHRFQWMFNCF